MRVVCYWDRSHFWPKVGWMRAEQDRTLLVWLWRLHIAFTPRPPPRPRINPRG